MLEIGRGRLESCCGFRGGELRTENRGGGVGTAGGISLSLFLTMGLEEGWSRRTFGGTSEDRSSFGGRYGSRVVMDEMERKSL